MHAFISIGIGAALGAWLRWWFSIMMNHIFPTIPLGTLDLFRNPGFVDF